MRNTLERTGIDGIENEYVDQRIRSGGRRSEVDGGGVWRCDLPFEPCATASQRDNEDSGNDYVGEGDDP